jgi:hypothetical protein
LPFLYLFFFVHRFVFFCRDSEWELWRKALQKHFSSSVSRACMCVCVKNCQSSKKLNYARDNIVKSFSTFQQQQQHIRRFASPLLCSNFAIKKASDAAKEEWNDW